MTSPPRLTRSTTPHPAGIVHVGPGAFFRAFIAPYTDEAIAAGGPKGEDWGIIAVSLKSPTARDALIPQRCLYAALERGPDGDVPRQVGAITDVLVAPENPAAVLDAMARPEIRIVTLTVTEKGYCHNPRTGSLQTDHPDIAHDIATIDTPRTALGFLVLALARRREAGIPPFTVLCCDNLPSNGAMLRQLVTEFARQRDAAGTSDRLAEWIAGHVAFPSAMVDRITPRTTPALIDEAEALFPGKAHSPIHSEDYIQWVLEDNFASSMPDLTRAGVEIVKDVDPYEEAKIRILNGGHTGLAYLGALAGHATFDEAMRDADLRRHFDGLETQEVLPGLQLELPFDRASYCLRVAERFANEAIADALERICMDGFAKFPIFIRPTIEGCLAQGITPRHSYESIASWYVYARRSAAQQTSIPYHEPNWPLLAPMLEPGCEANFAASSLLWGDLPDRYPGFVDGIVNSIEEMDRTWPA